MKKVLMGALCFIALSNPAGYAQDAATGAGNLLKNPMFALDGAGNVSGWETMGNWRGGAIESFHGLPFTMNYLKMDGKDGKLVQKDISVKPKTWYALECWYEGAFKRDGCFQLYAVPAGEWAPDSKRYNQAERYQGDLVNVEDPSLPPPGGVRFGSAKDWVAVKAYVFSGAADKVVFIAAFRGVGACGVGNCVLRELTAGDFMNADVADRKFNLGVPGAEPLNFTAHTEAASRVVIGERKGQSATAPNAMTIAPGKDKKFSYVIGPQSLLVRGGERVKVTFWARKSAGREAEEAGRAILTVFSLRQSKWYRTADAFMLTDKWEKIAADIAVPKDGAAAIDGPQLLDICLQVAGGDTRTVFISDFNVEIVSGNEKKGEEPGSWYWSPTGKNLVMNGSFEAGRKGWQPTFSTWSPSAMTASLGDATLDADTAAVGRYSLRIDIPAFPENSRKPSVISAVDQVGEKAIVTRLVGACFPIADNQRYTFSFYAKTDNPEKIRISGDGKPVAPTREWARYSWTFRPKSDRSGFYGPALLIHGYGKVWIDGAMVEKGETATAFETAEPVDIGADFTRRYPYYLKSDAPELTAYINVAGNAAKTLVLVETIRDWKEKILAKREKTIVAAAGETIREKRALPHDAYGVFEVTLELKDPATKQRASYYALNYGVFPETDNSVNADKYFFGVIPFLRQFWFGWNTPGGSCDELQRTLRAIGCRWTAEYGPTDWNAIEVSKGDWSGWGYDAYLENAKKLGFNTYVSFGGKFIHATPPWAFGDEPVTQGDKQAVYRGLKYFYPRVSDWEDYVRRVAEHYKGKIAYYDFMPETGGATVEQYFKYARLTREILKKIDPDAKFMGPGYPSQVLPKNSEDNTWIGKLFKMGAYDVFDIITGHFYPSGSRATKSLEDTLSATGTVIDDLREKTRYFRATYGNKPIWDTEYGLFNISKYPWFYSWHIKRKFWGYYAADLYSTNRKHAERFVRWNVLKMEAGVVRSFHHCFGHPALNVQWCQSLVHPDYSPKAVCGAFAQANRRLLATKFIANREIGSFFAELFDCDGKEIVVYWDYALDGQEKTLPVAALDPNDIDAEDLMGNPITLERKEGKTLLPLSSAPVYIFPKAQKGKELLTMLGAAREEANNHN